MNPKIHTSIAERYARGLVKPDHPADEVTVKYYWRLYPEIDVQAITRDMNVGDEPRNAMPYTYGWTACLHYANAETGEEIHRFEVTRSTKAEVIAALREMPPSIAHPRQRRVFRSWLREHRARLDRIAAE